MMKVPVILIQKEQNVKITKMKFKKIYIFLLLLLNLLSFSQDRIINKYNNFFLIDDLENVYEAKPHYILNTKELYGMDKKIELYNFLIDDKVLILFSVLPVLWNGENWVKVNYNELKDKIVPKEDIDLFISKKINEKENKSLKYGIVKKIGNDYYCPSVCLTEFFITRAYDFPFIVNKKTININDRKVTIKEMKYFWDKTIPKYTFPLDMRKRGSLVDGTLERYYLSKEYSIKGNTAYQFWTFNSWNVFDYYNLQRGIDRFVYIPNKGIVGGSYDFYFEFHLAPDGKISRDQIWDNIINEKVMIAEELK
ncbi:hypothetical protein [Elizabethkingia sp. M8]|uniref:hypothetical protein n=1 Tax=Elizabethkingia sp. M8 TaxID=2796140 RepID=UPI0019041853|nr:hypothetical protein [Elizabethkingia sp. M8]QQM26834.1 hypothetical protein JCR23_18765 [Elizabethkingia sp. M8]